MVLVLQLPLHWAWIQAPSSSTLANPFHGTHIWAVEALSRAWAAGTWPDPTSDAGFPLAWRARFVGWAVLAPGAALAAVWRGSPILWINLSAWLGPALGALAAVRLYQRVSLNDGPPARRGAALVMGGAAFGLAPVTLGAAASGQIENAQSWVLPWMLLALLRAQSAPPLVALPAAGLIWAIGGATSPYLAFLAAVCAPLLLWRAGQRGPADNPAAPSKGHAARVTGRALSSLAVGAVALLLVRAWLSPAGFDPSVDLFRPAWVDTGWPSLWTHPASAASLDQLLFGQVTLQAKAMVFHQPHPGWVVMALAWLGGAERRRWVAALLVGVALALGPELGWAGEPVTIGGHSVPLPAVGVRWLGLPLAHGGQYYRCALLISLALGGMIAGARPRPAVALLATLLIGADSIRAVSAPGLPWPAVGLPVRAWSALAAAEPAPLRSGSTVRVGSDSGGTDSRGPDFRGPDFRGPDFRGIVHLPLFSPHTIPNHPVRLAGLAVHGRPLADLPRGWTEPPDQPLLIQLDRCTQRGHACPLPTTRALFDLGFRYAILDLPDVPERVSLGRRIEAQWGPPTAEIEGLRYWDLSP